MNSHARDTRHWMLSPPVIAFGIVFVGQSWAANPAVTVNVDASASRRPISPLIYGVNWASSQQLGDLNSPLNRQGGNATSRYNWQLNASNRGRDWYFETIGEASATPGELGDTFIGDSRAGGAEPMLTIPMLDWVAKLGPNRVKLASFSIAKYGAQTGNDWRWFPDAGNGISISGAYITNNDPNDAHVASDVAFQRDWVDHLVAKWGGAENGGLRYYILDNEPSIWHSTHRDVHPTGATMDEMRERIIACAASIKSADPGAVVVGPEEWGWTGYFRSGYDQQWGATHGWTGPFPDRSAHGNWYYLPWLLDQLRQEHGRTGQRLLDVFSVHYYPQGGESSDDLSEAKQLLRNRSTRSLWDPNYLDESWIDDKVRLIPRLKDWVNTYYPGTRIAITEYDWGAESHISGAIAQADVLGIFGREGLDMAARWEAPAATTPTYQAFKMYRNYDGRKSAFGDISVAAVAPNPDEVAVFAAERGTDGALTVMLLNKYLTGDTPVTVSLANFIAAGSAERWQLTSTNTIIRARDLSFAEGSASLMLPARSITLLIVPRNVANQPPAATITATPSSGTAPVAVSFSGTGSVDPDGSIVSHAWNFGDGVSATGVVVTHTYMAPGLYTATLIVTDNDGATGGSSMIITATENSSTVNAPSSLAGSVSGRTATLTWKDNSGNESGFYVERRLASRNNWARVAILGQDTIRYSETLVKETYVYRVQAFNGSTGGVSAYSNEVKLRIKR